MTVSFTDMRGFTRMAEQLAPEQVRETINAYLEEAIAAIDAHGATVGQIVGDEVYALYGAPRHVRDHAWRAIFTAVDQQRRIRRAQSEFRSLGKVMPDCGCGINSGEMVLGNIGSESRQVYTVIGLAVNLASRLCGAARAGEILLTEATVQAALSSLPEGWELREEFEPTGDAATQELGAKVEAILPLPEEVAGRRVLVGPGVSTDPTRAVYVFRYLYALKVKGFSGPMPVLAVETLSEVPEPVAFREETEEVQGERIFGRYRLLSVLGRGGMSEVWRAKDTFGNVVAVKILRVGEGASDAQLARFRREGQIMARLAHRYICRVFEIGIAEGITFIAMECIQGASLADVIHGAENPTTLDDAEATTDLSRLVRAVTSGAQSRVDDEKADPFAAASRRLLPTQQVVALMIKVCDAVQFAHEHGVLHRDLKPGNIMLRQDGEPAVMDFGLAKFTEPSGEEMSLSVTDQIFGTIEYMAPEQAHSSKHVDERADVYALGGVLYRLLTGARHFTPTDNLLADAQRLQTYDPVRPRVVNAALDVDLETITLKALRSDKEQRYRSVQALREDLERFQKSEEIAARPPSMAEMLGKVIKRHKALSATIGAAVVTLIGVIIAAFFSISGERDKALLARDDADIHRMAAEAINLVGTSPAPALEMAVNAVEAAVKRFGSPTVRVQNALTTTLEGARQKAGFDTGLRAIESFAVGGAGQIVAISGDNGKLVIIDIVEANVVSSMAHGSEVVRLAVSANGKVIATAARDGTIKRWSAKAEPLGEPWKVTGWATALALNADGSLIASGEGDRSLHLRDSLGREICPPQAGHADSIAMLAFRRDGKVLASIDDGIFASSLRLWADVGPRMHAGPTIPQGGSVVAFSRAGESVITGTQRVNRYNSDNLMMQAGIGYDVGSFNSISVSVDGTRLAFVTLKGEVHVFEYPHLNEFTPGNLGSSRVKGAAFGADARTLITLGEDCLVRVWDLAGFEIAPQIEVPGHIANSISWSGDGSNVVFATESNGVTAVDFEHRENSWTSEWKPKRSQHSPRANRSEFWMVGDARELHLFRKESSQWQIAQRLSFPQPLRSVAWNDAAGRLALIANDGLRVVSMEGQILVHHPEQQPWMHAAIAWEPAGRWFLTNSEIEAAARVWNHEGKPLPSLQTTLGSPLRSLAYSPDGRVLALGFNDGHIALFDGEKLTSRLVFSGHQSSIHSLAFSPDSKVLAAGSTLGMLRLFDLAGNPVTPVFAAHQGKIASLSFRPDGRILASGGEDFRIHFWAAEWQGWLDLARQRAGLQRLRTGAAEGVAAGDARGGTAAGGPPESP